MKRAIGVAAIVMLAAALYLALWPVPVRPVAWVALASPGYTGVHAENHRLAGLRSIALDPERGPEHVAFGGDGHLYVAVLGGKVLRMDADGERREVFADTGGRVLGFDFDAHGNLIAADAFRGLLRIDREGEIEVLVDRHDDRPIGYANAVAVARDGRIYFSDSSTRFSAAVLGSTFEASVLDIMEQSATGRVLEHDPASGSTRIVAHGLSFANGLVMSEDGRALLVAETGRYRVWRVAVDAHELDVGSGTAQAGVLLDNLPGYPDNLMRGRDGRIWVGLVKPRSALVDRLSARPFLRTLTLRLPRALWPVPRPYGHVLAFTEDGRIVADLQDPSGAYPDTTAVTETADRLYIQSLHADRLGWLPVGNLVRAESSIPRR